MFENIEPHADIRKAATVTFEMYAAFQQSGFTEAQAFDLARALLVAGSTQPPPE